jgi:hypothetical protein
LFETEKEQLLVKGWYKRRPQKAQENLVTDLKLNDPTFFVCV